MVHLQKLNADVDLCSFHGRETESTTHRTHLPPQFSQRKSALLPGIGGWDILNPAAWSLLRGKDGICIDLYNTISGCDTSTLGKSQEGAHPRNTTHPARGLMELVTTGLAVPLERIERLQLAS